MNSTHEPEASKAGNPAHVESGRPAFTGSEYRADLHHVKRRLAGIGLLAVLALVPSLATAARSDCNVIVSMSQGRQIFFGAGETGQSELESLTGEQWMALIEPGKVLSWWTTAANWGDLTELNRCGMDIEIDRVVFIFDPHMSGEPGDNGATMRIHLNQVLAITAARYPNAVTDLTMLVGADGQVPCPDPVRAAKTHAARIGQLRVATADLKVRCAGFMDRIGHLSDVGATVAQRQLGAFYAGG